jgi:ligand-binding sensor domain-containing protein
MIFLLLAILLVLIGYLYIRRDKPTPSTLNPSVRVILKDFDINVLAQQGETLWMGGKAGVKALNLSDYREINIPDELAELQFVRGLAVDSTGLLWIGHFDGLMIYDGNRVIPVNGLRQLPDKRVNTVYLDRQGRIWVGTWDGAYWWDGKNWFTPSYGSGLIHPMVNVIYQDSHLGMWFGSYVAPKGGVSYLNNNQWMYITVNNGLPHPNITAIVEDQEEIWIGAGLFQRGGAARINLNSETIEKEISLTLSKSVGLAGEKVRSIFVTGTKELWLGSEYDGISIYKDGFQGYLSVQDGLSHNEVKCFLENDHGLWIGTRHGLNLIDLNSLNL